MDLVFSRTKKIPANKFGRECSLCSSRHGVPIECSARGCKAAYHTTCAIRGKLKMQAIFGRTYKGGIKLRSYCKDHTPSVKLENGLSGQADTIDANGVKEIDMTNLADDRLQESNEELDYFWKYVDINEVHKKISGDSKQSNSLKKTKNKSSSMIDLIYRYWILLRTANNGQSLIKFSPSALKEKECEQRKSIMRLRIELERVRNLSYMIGKREKLKSSWLKSHQNIIKRTLSVIDDLNPVADVLHQTQHLQPTNGMFDESDQLINDLLTCDQIYEIPGSSSHTNNNLPYQERCTLEGRRTLSLVRRINRQLKNICYEPSMNPYAKSYLVPKRSDSPVGATSTAVSTTAAANHQPANHKILKYK